MIIIRAPSIFRIAWAIAKNFFRQSLRRKMIFAPSNYLEVLDEFIPRDALPPSIAQGGLGRVAMGMPPLIGDVENEPLRDAMFTTKEVVHNIDSHYESSISLTATDDGSAGSADEFCWTSPNSQCSVSGSALCKGVWVDHVGGDSEVFTTAVA